MVIKNNERGGALLLVLMLVVVFTVVGMGLLTMNISASKQFSKKEEQVQERHLAEMGVLHYKAEVEQIVKRHNEKMVEIVSINSGELLESKINEEKAEFCRNISGKESIESSGKNYTVIASPPDECNQEIKIPFRSEGAVGNDSGSIINAVISIKQNSDSEEPSTPGNEIEDTTEDSNTEVKFDKSKHVYNKPITIEDPQTFNNKVSYNFKEAVNFMKNLILNTAGGSKSSPVIEAEKDLVVGEKLTLSQHNKVNVGGNLNIVGKLEMGNHACIAVNGNFTTQETSFKNHSVLVIYGDGHFDKKPTGGSVYIQGKLFVNGKEVTNTFNEEISNKKGCKESDEFSNSDNSGGGSDTGGAENNTGLNYWSNVNIVEAFYGNVDN